MARTYRAVMLDAETGGEGRYTFSYPGDLMHETADEVIHQFFNHVDKAIFTHHVDYEINSAFKNKDRRIVTGLGSLIVEHSGKSEDLPFLLMISEA
jgi:hypothetical protein